MWVDYKHIELPAISLDYGYIYLTIHWYKQIPGIYESDLVYRLYCDNPPQFQIHAQLLHGRCQ